MVRESSLARDALRSSSGESENGKMPERPRPPQPKRRRDRGRLTKRPALESVSESHHWHPSFTESDTTETSVSSDYGVKSYLHHFYEDDPNFKDNEDVFREDYQFLIPPPRRRCSAFWWKAAIWVGVNLLILGAISLLVGYTVPERKEVVGYENDNVIIDKAAVMFNYRLDVAKLAGLIILCVGGFILAIALLVPAFITTDDDDREGFKVKVSDSTYAPYLSYGRTVAIGQEDPVPCTAEVKSVQPKRESESTVVEGAESAVVGIQG